MKTEDKTVETGELRESAREAGADVFGVANIERFDELPPEKHPRAIFPETKSVILLGRRIPRGALRGVEEGTNFTNYAIYGLEWLDNRFTSLVTFRVCEFIEDNGWEACPLPNLPPEVPPMGVTVRVGQPAPNVMLDFEDAAVRAGVGEIGYCGLLLTPQFGTRQRVQMVLTDADIEPTAILQEAVDPRTQEFKDVCPLGAFVGETEIEVCGIKMLVAEIDYAKCRNCKNGAIPNRMHPAGKPDRIAALCGRTCMDLLERRGRVLNRFQVPQRRREAWLIRPEVNLYEF